MLSFVQIMGFYVTEGCHWTGMRFHLKTEITGCQRLTFHIQYANAPITGAFSQ